jgi:hypothetical protein
MTGMIVVNVTEPVKLDRDTYCLSNVNCLVNSWRAFLAGSLPSSATRTIPVVEMKRDRMRKPAAVVLASAALSSSRKTRCHLIVPRSQGPEMVKATICCYGTIGVFPRTSCSCLIGVLCTRGISRFVTFPARRLDVFFAELEYRNFNPEGREYYRLEIAHNAILLS